MRRVLVLSGALAFLGACGSSALPEDAVDASGFLTADSGGSPVVDAGASDAPLDRGSDSTITLDAGADVAAPLDATPEAGPADSAPDAATLPTDTTFTMDGVSYHAYALYETQDNFGLPVPVRVFRFVLWADTALTSPMCTVARKGHMSGSRELMVEIHRKADANTTYTLPVATYTVGTSGPDDNTMLVNIRYYQYGAPACLPPVEQGDAIQPSKGAGSVTVTSVSASNASATFSLQVDTNRPPRRSFTGTVTAGAHCPNPAMVSGCF